MEIGQILAGLISSAIFSFGLGQHQVSSSGYTSKPLSAKVSETAQTAQFLGYKTKLTCKTGFKAGKTPVSLKVGAKVGCYNVKQAAAGRKLLTSDRTKTCYVCHAPTGIYPVTQTNSNLRNQGYTLKSADILAAFNAHLSEMSGATLNSKEATAIGHYLQSIK